MAKTTAWIFTILGVLALPPVMSWVESIQTGLWWWIFALLFLVVGITKLVRNYSHKRR